MRCKANGAALLLLWAFVPFAALAQHKVQKHEDLTNGPRTNRVTAFPHKASPQPFLLNANQGLSVIGAALESRGRARSKPDCSHLVHTIYGRAGFPYSYVSSSDLYAGIEQFHRVKHIQSGDLVVWPGHVGIVVNPSQDTFFGSFSSGIGVESYSSPYWKKRGLPRFYRYVRPVGTKGTQNKAGASDPKRGSLDASLNLDHRRVPGSRHQK